MTLEPKEIQHRITLFRESLARCGVRLTHQRLVIFNEVAKSLEHPDAETIYKGVRKRLPTVSLDTVYRTLWLFLDLGLISTLNPPRERVRFDANLDPHHHFVCTKCGSISDFHCKELNKLKISNSVRSLGKVEKTQVEVKGLCLRCLNSKSK